MECAIPPDRLLLSDEIYQIFIRLFIKKTEFLMYLCGSSMLETPFVIVDPLGFLNFRDMIFPLKIQSVSMIIDDDPKAMQLPDHISHDGRDFLIVEISCFR